MRNKFLKQLMFISAVLSMSFAIAQSTVTGTVSDGNGPLPGASVIVKGTTNGTETDFDGKFTLSEVPSDGVLVVSFVGYKPQEVKVNGRSTIDVTLSEDSNQLSEVVVVGYTQQTRGDITGSVASVDMEEASKVPVTNAAEALQGRVTGVSVVNSTRPGAAPKVTIRGFGTTNNTNPLYIIDGVQTDDANVFNAINPSDIEQMNVLKDGAAAIYGARASNGVIIVTTKTGGYNMDKARVSFDVYTGSSRPTNLPEMLNAQQHGQMLLQSLLNDKQSNPSLIIGHPQYDPNQTGTFTVPTTLRGFRADGTTPIPSVTISPQGTNWPEAITRNAPTTNVNFSLQNGTQTGKYFLSVNYLTRDGILNNTFFKRGATRLNSEFKFLDGKVRVGEHANIAYSNGNSGVEEAFANALRSSPLVPTVDDEGNFAGTYNNTNRLGISRNPYAQLERGKHNYNKSLRVFGDVYAEVDIIDGLRFKTSIGASLNNFDSRSFTSLDPEHGEPLSTNTLNVFDQVSIDWNWSNTLTYNKSFGDHKVDVLLGTEAVKNSGNGKGITRTGYLFEDPDFYNLTNGSGTPNVYSAYKYENSLFSIFGSVNYAYAGKYFLTATLRNDKTSRFIGDNISGTFPSFSVGWLVSKENFFPQDGIVSRLKLKGSYGEMGNQTLPFTDPTVNISVLSEQYSNYAINGSSIATGAFQERVGNPDLKWETSKSTNFGIELGFLDNKLTLEAEYFNILTDGLIGLNFNRIPSTGPDAIPPLENLGSTKNTGFDLSIGYNDRTESDFSYGVLFNLSHYKNEVTSLGSASNFLVPNVGLRGGDVHRTEVGRPISSFYGREIIGFDANGRFEYRDINGDGTINGEDRTYIGSPHPDFTYGINLNLGYKGFDLAAFFTGSKGNDLYNYNKIYTDFPSFFNMNRSTRVLDSWTPENTNATLPALSASITNDETNPNTYFVEDGSFFRLKNLQIGYNLPESITGKIKSESVRIYVQGTNLFTITDYTGVDPEIVSYNNIALGLDNQIYPIAKIFTLGVNIKL